MGRRKGIGLGIVVLMAVFFVVGMTGTAFATTPDNLGDASNLTPHGGYSTATDYCLQCHNPHGSAATVGEGLLNQVDVDQVCATCHSVGGAAAGTPVDPGYSGAEAVASTEGAYKYGAVNTYGAGGNSGHRLNTVTTVTGSTNVMITGVASGWAYKWGRSGVATPGMTNAVNGADDSGELTCTSCHTPHGNFGQLINYSSTSHNWPARTDGATPIGSAGWAWATDGTDDMQTFTKAQIVDGTRVWYEPQSGTVPANGYAVDQAATLNAGPTGPTPCTPSDPVNPLGGAPVACANGTPYYGYLDVQAQGGGGGAILTNSGVRWCADAGLTNCVTMMIKDRDSQMSALPGYKMLSQYPNHQWEQPTSWYLDYRGHDVPSWCGKCHANYIDSGALNAATFAAWQQVELTGGALGSSHAHPTACTACHGNYTGTGNTAQSDFPHQSEAQDLLANYPDALCITGCHTEPTLP